MKQVLDGKDESLIFFLMIIFDDLAVLCPFQQHFIILIMMRAILVMMRAILIMMGGDYEGLCAQKCNLGSYRILPPAGPYDLKLGVQTTQALECFFFFP